MLAKQVSTDKEIYCTTDTSLPELFQIMLENKISCVPIVESIVHKNIIGAVTEHDICLKTITDGLNPQRITAGRVMNGNITTVNCEASVEECTELMKLTDSERLFVIDDNGAFCGILTDAELKFVKPFITHEPVYTDLAAPTVLSQQIQLSH